MPDRHGTGKRPLSLASDELGAGGQEDSKSACRVATAVFFQDANDPVRPAEVFIEVRRERHGQPAGLERQRLAPDIHAAPETLRAPTRIRRGFRQHIRVQTRAIRICAWAIQ
jgi:hypothetical protein